MDLDSFVIAIVIIMLAVQFQLNWIAFSAAILMIIVSKKASSAIFILAALGIAFFTADQSATYGPLILIGAVVFALLFGLAEAPKEESYPPDMGSLFGGMGV